jgi:hypothetical protein
MTYGMLIVCITSAIGVDISFVIAWQEISQIADTDRWFLSFAGTKQLTPANFTAMIPGNGILQ